MNVPDYEIEGYFKYDPVTRYKLDNKLKGITAYLWERKWFRPPLEKTIFIGLIAAILYFSIVFLFIHGVYKLSTWIIEGFKEKQ